MLSMKILCIVLCLRVSLANEVILESVQGLLQNQYNIRPVDLVASVRGYKETVCHNEFCCEFLVKTASVSPSHRYSFVVAEGNDGQRCGIVSCDGTDDRCVIRPNRSETIFKEIEITGNFTSEKQLPTAVSAAILPVSGRHLVFDRSSNKNFKMAALRLVEPSDIAVFGIFEKDVFENVKMQSSFYDFIFDENDVEFIDYLWIRAKILLFIISVYFLEMM